MTSGHKALAGAANHVLGIKDGKKRFVDTARQMSKAFSLCCMLDEVKAVREEVAFFHGIKVILTKKRPLRAKEDRRAARPGDPADHQLGRGVLKRRGHL